jgi:hypothetical protein
MGTTRLRAAINAEASIVCTLPAVDLPSHPAIATVATSAIVNELGIRYSPESVGMLVLTSNVPADLSSIIAMDRTEPTKYPKHCDAIPRSTTVVRRGCARNGPIRGIQSQDRFLIITTPMSIIGTRISVYEFEQNPKTTDVINCNTKVLR